MIVYFANRYMDILGQASTKLPYGLIIEDDIKTEEIETGVSSLELWLPFDDETRADLENSTSVGNYILRSHKEEQEFYTIIESESDTKKQQVYVYAESAGLDLLNEIVGPYAADKAYPVSHYINKYINDSGFEIGINEIPDLTRKLSWDGDATATERIASVATQFDGCEISYTFKIKGLEVKKKYVNIHKQRGKDIGVQLRLNKEVDRIITKKSIANLATALQCEGGVPEGEEETTDPITLKGFAYDDGDFYVDSEGILRSRKAVQNWGRLVGNNMSHIVRQFSYDTQSQQTLCARAITELKKLREVELNFEIDVQEFPEDVQVGDRVNVVDDAGNLYLSTRLLKLETSITQQEQTATLGEHLIKKGGISQKVIDLAAQFAKMTVSVQNAQNIANTAKVTAQAAQTQANAALKEAENAQTQANSALTEAQRAYTEAEQALAQASAAEAKVDVVENNVASIQKTVDDAQAAAEYAKQAAQTAEQKAEEAKQSATNAQSETVKAQQAAANAQSKAEEAIATASTAQTTAATAKSEAEEAQTIANAAKLDAEAAQKDIDALAGSLITLESTMQADYARKTDLTETEASLQSQITQNAAQIQTTVSTMQTIDETANSAKEIAEAAQTNAGLAQTQADQATAEAQAAQQAADQAKTAATNAQSEADKAKAAAQAAQSVADKAKNDLAAAEADLATVTSRVGATEEEIAEAKQAVATAKAAADAAQAEADTAAQKATNAQSTADKAVTNAANAQTTANEAVSKANIAQQAADEAKGNAQAAQATADEAKTKAEAAQATANTAKTNATNAQNTANEAAAAALAAQNAADEAEAKATKAEADLLAAQQNLAEVTSRVDATAEEVEAAKADVAKAQAAAETAKTNAQAAQSTADTAKANAQAAQTAANNAQAAADKAQEDAQAAQEAADQAQAAVDALAVRVTTAETKITQTSQKIELLATKEEVTKTLGGYYTKSETEAAIALESNAIESRVSTTYSTKQEMEDVQQGVVDTQNEVADNKERIEVSESLIQQLSDCISMLVTDGNGASLMTQTENGWTFSMKQTNDTMFDLSSGLDELQKQTGSTQATVDALQSAVSDLGVLANYVKITTDGSQPCIELGTGNSDFKLLITNTDIRFMEGSAVVAYINNQSLYIEKANITELQQGNWVWKQRSNGNYGLQWKGASS